MAKLRCNSVNDPILNQIEWEGTPQELLSIYDGLKQRLGNTIQLSSPITIKYDVTRRPTIGQLRTQVRIVPPDDYADLAQKMPTVDQLMLYILGKPKFQHDIVDIELNFFKKQINSRKYGRLYRELRNKLEMARKNIESTQHGAFERRSTRPRNLQVYTFRQMSSVLTQPEPQKPS
jgi:hypothetical protein